MKDLELISDPITGNYTLLKRFRAADGSLRFVDVGLGQNEAITKFLALIQQEIMASSRPC